LKDLLKTYKKDS